MKKVTAFETSDGKVHSNEGVALEHEFAIELRGTIQRNCTPLRSDQVSLRDVCQCIVDNHREITDVIRKYRQKIDGFRKREAINPTVVVLR